MTRAEEEAELRRLCRVWGVTGVSGVLTTVALFCEAEANKELASDARSQELHRWRRLTNQLREAAGGFG
jgi:hypothetical protein